MQEFHRVNLMEALAAMQAQPDCRVSLDRYRGPDMRGHQFCLAGLVAWLPHFRAQGVYPDPKHGGPVMAGADGKLLTTQATLLRLFGPFVRDGYALFAMYGQGAWDAGLFEQLEQLPSHKELALLRLRHGLQLVISDMRNGAVQDLSLVAVAPRKPVARKARAVA